MVPAMSSVESTECEENGMTVYRKTVKIFGLSIYKLKASYSSGQRDRPIGFQASPVQPQYIEEDYEE